MFDFEAISARNRLSIAYFGFKISLEKLVLWDMSCPNLDLILNLASKTG
jgi:hypothetical protein